MNRTGIAILGACGVFMGWVFLSLLLLLYGNDWWLSGLITFTVFYWFAGLLVVIYQQGRVRAAATGAVIAAATYWLLALGPWFSTNVGPTLLSSRLLASADELLHGNPPQSQAVAWTSYPPPVYVTGSPGVVTPSTLPLTPQSTAFPFPLVNITTAAPGGSVFQPIGQWLFIWLCAAVGGCAALLMQMRSEPKRPRPAPVVVGESPFAPTATSSRSVPLEAKETPPGAAS